MELKQLAKTLEQIRKQNGIEYWLARDLFPLLGYKHWRDFKNVIEKAKISCETSNHPIDNHFVDLHKLVKIGSNTTREIEDIKLSRYACYLIAQNGDPKITEIAFAQMYFAYQTRKQELIEQRIEEIERLVARGKLSETEKEFASTIYDRGVDGRGISEIRFEGDKALFGGLGTPEMRRRLNITDPKKPIADVLPTVNLKAKEFATSITSHNTKERNLYGKNIIKAEHVKNNEKVRKVLTDDNIIPENLPPEEDIKLIKKRHKKLIKHDKDTNVLSFDEQEK